MTMHAAHVFDLSDELMRFAINPLSDSDTYGIGSNVLQIPRIVSTGTDSFVPLIHHLWKQQQVTMQSTRKIKGLSYAVNVRSSGFGSDLNAFRAMLRRALAGESAGKQRFR